MLTETVTCDDVDESLCRCGQTEIEVLIHQFVMDLPAEIETCRTEVSDERLKREFSAKGAF